MLRKSGVLPAALVVAAGLALSGPVAAQSNPDRAPSAQTAKARPAAAPAQAGKAREVAPPAKRGLLDSIRDRLRPARPDRHPPIRCRD
jgi:hypothetical protein